MSFVFLHQVRFPIQEWQMNYFHPYSHHYDLHQYRNLNEEYLHSNRIYDEVYSHVLVDVLE